MPLLKLANDFNDIAAEMEGEEERKARMIDEAEEQLDQDLLRKERRAGYRGMLGGAAAVGVPLATGLAIHGARTPLASRTGEAFKLGAGGAAYGGLLGALGGAILSQPRRNHYRNQQDPIALQRYDDAVDDWVNHTDNEADFHTDGYNRYN